MRAILIWLVFLITVLTVTAPLIDRVLSPNVLNVLESGVDNLEYFIWSDNINIFLIIIAVILILTIYRRANKFFHNSD